MPTGVIQESNQSILIEIMKKFDLPKRVIFIGASSCFGKGDTLGGGYAGRFKQWYENASEDEIFSVYNLGIPGDTVDGMLTRFNEIERRKPHFVIVQLGSNECIRKESKTNFPQTSLRSYKTKVGNFLDKIKGVCNLILISNLPLDEIRTAPVEWAQHYYLLEDVKIYSNTALKVAETLKIPTINIMEDWLNKDYELLLSEDGLHPNENGHEYIFQKLRDQFLNLYGIKIK